MSSGFVYLIHNSDMSKFYIGSTNSIYRRFKHHKSLLRRGIHHCVPLQRSWDKHGENHFEFTTILENVTRESAALKEHELLSMFFRKYGCLNISSNGLMSAQCPDVIAKRNNTLKSDAHRLAASAIAKSWRESHPDLAIESDKKSALTRSSPVCRAANSKRGKLQSESSEAKEKFVTRMKNFYANGGVVNARQVIRTESDGTETFYKSISEAAKILSCHINGISMCCLGKRKHTTGSTWRYAEGNHATDSIQ